MHVEAIVTQASGSGEVALVTVLPYGLCLHLEQREGRLVLIVDGRAVYEGTFPTPPATMREPAFIRRGDKRAPRRRRAPTGQSA
jgi:hypothetical protein